MYHVYTYTIPTRSAHTLGSIAMEAYQVLSLLILLGVIITIIWGAHKMDV